MPVKKSERLTDRQRSILKFIERHVLANGYPPTIREIGSRCAIATCSTPRRTAWTSPPCRSSR